MPRPLSLLAIIALSGCVRDLPASDLGAEARLLFRDFDDDPDALGDILARMDAGLADLDLEADPRDRMFDVPELSEAFLGGASVPDRIDASRQMRAGLAGLSRHPLDDNLVAQVEVNQTCINADAVECHERAPAPESDPACFVDGACDVYRTENTLRIETFAFDFWLEFPLDIRRVTMPDGREAAVGRAWLESFYPSDGGGTVWRQRFGVDVFIEDPDDARRTRRFYATWVAPRMEGVAGWFGEPSLRGGLDEGFTNADDWLDDRTCAVTLRACLADSSL